MKTWSLFVGGGGYSNLKVTGISKQGAFGVGFRRKKRIIHWVWDQKRKKLGLFWCELPKKGFILCKFCQIWVKFCLFSSKKGVIIQADNFGRHMGVPLPELLAHRRSITDLKVLHFTVFDIMSHKTVKTLLILELFKT